MHMTPNSVCVLMSVSVTSVQKFDLEYELLPYTSMSGKAPVVGQLVAELGSTERDRKVGVRDGCSASNFLNF